jgi:ribonuclease HI
MKDKDNNKDKYKLTEVRAFTDGACLGNPGPGGWGYVLSCGESKKEDCGGEPKTTNNRMELMAAINSLSALNRPCKVTLHTDSRYVVDGIEKGWAKSWKAKNWMRTKTEPAKNPDLWDKLLDLCETHDARFVWVKGHAESPKMNTLTTLQTPKQKESSAVVKRHCLFPSCLSIA